MAGVIHRSVMRAPGIRAPHAEQTRAAVPLSPRTSQGARKEGETAVKLVDILQGKWLGHPLHPAVVHLPLGL